MYRKSVIKNFIVTVLFIALVGCSHPVRIVPVSPISSSSYRAKIPGKFVMVLDDSLSNISQDIYLQGVGGNPYRPYSIKIKDELKVSVIRTLQSVFMDIIEQSTIPPRTEFKHMSTQGSVQISLNTFEPRLDSKFLASEGDYYDYHYWIRENASVSIGFDVTITMINGESFSTLVSGLENLEAILVSPYEKGVFKPIHTGRAIILAEAIEKAIKKALEEMVTFIVNLPHFKVQRSQGMPDVPVSTINRSIDEIDPEEAYILENN